MELLPIPNQRVAVPHRGTIAVGRGMRGIIGLIPLFAPRQPFLHFKARDHSVSASRPPNCGPQSSRDSAPSGRGRRAGEDGYLGQCPTCPWRVCPDGRFAACRARLSRGLKTLRGGNSEAALDVGGAVEQLHVVSPGARKRRERPVFFNTIRKLIKMLNCPITPGSKLGTPRER